MMKLNNILYIASVAAALCACSKMDEIAPASGTITQEQLQTVNEQDPSRAEAAFAGMLTNLGKPRTCFPTRTSPRPDDYGFLMICLSNDLEGADAIFPDSGYNWFSVCGEYSSRNADYANPYIRYKAPYNTISDANGIINNFPNDKNKVAQAKAIRAYAYEQLAPYFQGRYIENADKPCVPIVTETTTDFTQNPRASVKEVYELILSDLNDAIAALDAADAPKRANCAYVNKNVAYGLRARAYLAMGEWQKAYDDAVKAADGFSCATIKDVSKPSFMSISEKNWIWGYDMTAATAQLSTASTPSAWTRSFSADSYSAATGCYLCINTLLYDKISDNDVRKGWWVNKKLESPLLDGLTWGALKDQDIAYGEIADTKLQFLPYTNVKFGCLTMGTSTNEEDFPLMRVEEMLLIQAECQCALGNTDNAKTILESFAKNRDASYSYSPASCGGRSLADEIWFQRRVELWGEGFFVSDARRLNKNIVRTHGVGTTNQPDAFAFNIKADDPYLNMRFSQSEMDTNFSIVDNTGGSMPKAGQNPELRDGVTD